MTPRLIAGLAVLAASITIPATLRAESAPILASSEAGFTCCDHGLAPLSCRS